MVWFPTFKSLLIDKEVNVYILYGPWKRSLSLMKRKRGLDSNYDNEMAFLIKLFSNSFKFDDKRWNIFQLKIWSHPVPPSVEIFCMDPSPSNEMKRMSITHSYIIGLKEKLGDTYFAVFGVLLM